MLEMTNKLITYKLTFKRYKCYKTKSSTHKIRVCCQGRMNLLLLLKHQKLSLNKGTQQCLKKDHIHPELVDSPIEFLLSQCE